MHFKDEKCKSNVSRWNVTVDAVAKHFDSSTNEGTMFGIIIREYTLGDKKDEFDDSCDWCGVNVGYHFFRNKKNGKLSCWSCKSKQISMVTAKQAIRKHKKLKDYP
eukprot:118548_1